MSSAKGKLDGLIEPPGPQLKRHIPLKFVATHSSGNKKSM